MRLSEFEYSQLMLRRALRPLEAPRGQGAPPLSEKAFMAAVVRIAKQHGWQCFHPYDSRKSTKGYPDLTLARLPGPGRPGEGIWAELKVEAPLTIEQEVWLATLSHVTKTEAYLWTPDDMPVIVTRLQR